MICGGQDLFVMCACRDAVRSSWHACLVDALRFRDSPMSTCDIIELDLLPFFGFGGGNGGAGYLSRNRNPPPFSISIFSRKEPRYSHDHRVPGLSFPEAWIGATRISAGLGGFPRIVSATRNPWDGRLVKGEEIFHRRCSNLLLVRTGRARLLGPVRGTELEL